MSNWPKSGGTNNIGVPPLRILGGGTRRVPPVPPVFTPMLTSLSIRLWQLEPWKYDRLLECVMMRSLTSRDDVVRQSDRDVIIR